MFGCAGPAADYPHYPALDETMTTEIEPVVETILPGELRRDPEAVDYARIQTAALRAAFYFECAQNSGHEMYLKKESVRQKAKAAGDWFAEIAAAAAQKDHKALVELHKQSGKVCTTCHD